MKGSMKKAIEEIKKLTRIDYTDGDIYEYTYEEGQGTYKEVWDKLPWVRLDEVLEILENNTEK